MYWGIGLGVVALLGAAVLMTDNKKKKTQDGKLAEGSKKTQDGKLAEGSTVKLPTGSATIRRNPGCNCM